MVKNDNAHSIRMVDSLTQNIGFNEAKELEAKYPLSKSANIEKKYEWAKNVCNYLEEHFDTDTIIKLRKDCRCNDGKTIAKILLKYLLYQNWCPVMLNKYREQKNCSVIGIGIVFYELTGPYYYIWHYFCAGSFFFFKTS